MENKPSPYLEIRNAEVFQQDHRVFENLCIHLFLGENSCILGPNGAGKTTLLKLLTRELYAVAKPESYVRWFGSERCILDQLRQKIGLVSQNLQERYDAHIRGRDVVLSGLFGSVGIHKHVKLEDEHQHKADQLLQKFDLMELQDRRYWHLSTGQQRKFLLARALIHNPAVLILDEPSNGLDIKATFELMNDLRSLCKSGTTLLLVTHHIHEIIPEISRVITLKNGGVMKDGAKSEVLTSPHLSQLFETPMHLFEHEGFYQVTPAG